MPHSNTFCYEFGKHHLDVAERVLTREGQPIPLTPKATDVLLILLHKAGQLVEKAELINEVWPDAFVEEANLTQNIFLLRRTLQDDGDGPKFIETVARRGYRFVAPVRKVVRSAAIDDAAVTAAPIRATPILGVLPFLNATGNTELQYLAEGIPESLINSLSGLSQLRVISRSTAFRYKNREVDPQSAGQKLGADVLLIGKISGHEAALTVAVELVRVDNGWQLWGQAFGVDSENIFEIEDQITRQISRTLDLPLTREDEKRVAKRYTESAAAYQAYLEGRYHWSKYTRAGIEKAIGHFGRAIELDANYALAYAGIVDCYLRLATNYLPPEDGLPTVEDGEFSSMPLEAQTQTAVGQVVGGPQESSVANEKVKLRHEWDWKGAERELRRANELKTDYPASHQWHAAYVLSRDLLYESLGEDGARPLTSLDSPLKSFRHNLTIGLTASERVQVSCTVAREQIDSGNYDAACEVLRPWWTWGNRPTLVGLKAESCGDLLFTTGTLAGCVASARQIPQGQKHGEALLNGAIALFESLSARGRAAEAQIELALCYYRQGLFDLGRQTFEKTLHTLADDDRELRSLCLIRLASLERHAGRPRQALERLNEAAQSAGLSGPWATGRCHLEYASTLKDLAHLENHPAHYDSALRFYQAALREFEAIGNHRLAAICENNLGYMLIKLSVLERAEVHLVRAQRIFDGFHDRVLGAQVSDSLARLHLAAGRLDLAKRASSEAVAVLQEGDEDVLLAGALMSQGTILYLMDRRREGKAILERAYRVAERCGDLEGAGRALLIIVEDMLDSCDDDECQELRFRFSTLLARDQSLAVREQLEDGLRRASFATPNKHLGRKNKPT